MSLLRYFSMSIVASSFIIISFPLSISAAEFTVNSSKDEDVADDVLTLREAINFAQGIATRDPFDDPDPEAPDELKLIAGDTFGAGISDTVVVALSGQGNIILTSPLPTITQENDKFMAGTIERIDGSMIPNGTQVWSIEAANTLIQGFTLANFSDQGALDIAVDGCSIGRMRIENSRGRGLTLIGANNTEIFDLTVDGCFGNGLVLQGGTTNTTVKNTFIVNCEATGLLVTGSGTSNNRLWSLGVGVDSDGSYKGNAGYGIIVDRRATNNIFGPPGQTDVDDGNLSYVAANDLGGIEVAGSETAGNTFYSIVIGGTFTAERNDPWMGNGTTASNTLGHGLLVHEGANNNQFGQSRPNSVIAIGGHAGNGIMIRDLGTDNNSFNRCNVGWVESLVSTIAQTNLGHGIEIQGGVKNTKFGESPPDQDFFFTHIEVNFTGPDKHGIFLNGNDAENPISGTLIEHYHAGDRSIDVGQIDPYVFGGHTICVEGNVDLTTVGLRGHPNSTNGAMGYGIRLSGPEVRNVSLIQIIMGERFGFPNGNQLGGVLIEDGAHDISFFGKELDQRSYISGNAGHGITIDASSENVPNNIMLSNLTIGLSEFDELFPNEGSGIYIKGKSAEEPTELSGVSIGDFLDADDRDAVEITQNTQHGIELENVSNLPIINSLIGPVPFGEPGNDLDGIHVNGSHNIQFGFSNFPAGNENIISGNGRAGIMITNGSHDLSIASNIIGLSPDGTERMGNLNGVQVMPPGPAVGNSLQIGESGFMENVISGNDRNGILIGIDPEESMTSKQSVGEIRRVSILSNKIGTAVDGGSVEIKDPEAEGSLGNIGSGILLNGTEVQDVTIGSSTEFDDRNIISGNQKAGIEISDGAAGWKVMGNYIGLNLDGSLSVGNKDGVLLSNVNDGIIGTTNSDSSEGNIISGNNSSGISIRKNAGGDDLVIAKNFIGTDTTGLSSNLNLRNLNGVSIIGVDRSGTEPLTVGVTNSTLTDEADGFDLSFSNVISGNANDVQIFGDIDEIASKNIRIIGNLIGPGKTGDQLNNLSTPTSPQTSRRNIELIANAQSISDVTIGGMNAGEGNLIGSTSEESIFIRTNVSDVNILGNMIGLGGSKNKKLPIGKDGIKLENGAQNVHIEKNIITQSEESAIELSGETTRLNTWRDNSIFENKGKPVTISLGANDSIQTPRWRLTPVMDRNLSAVPLILGGAGEVELSVDPTFSEPGQWGQGKMPESNILTSTTAGELMVNLNSLNGDAAFVTAVYSTTNASGELLNSSEYTPIIEVTTLQTIDLSPDLLVAGKPTVVRAYLGPFISNTSARTAVTGTAEEGLGRAVKGSQRIPHELLEYGDYAADQDQREMGFDSLNIYIPDPGEGLQDFFIAVRDSNSSSIRTEGFILENFQKTNRFLTVLIPVTTSGGDPDLSRIPAATSFFADVYPANRADLMGGVILMQSKAATIKAHLNTERNQASVNTYVNNFLSRFRKSGRPAILGGAVVNAATIIDIGNQNSGTGGFTYPDGLTFVIKDSTRFANGNLFNPEHPGQLLAHEVGHTRVFSLGDTYTGGSLSSNNPRPAPADPSRVDATGIILREVDKAFSPTGELRFANLKKPRPLFTPTNGGTIYRDYMGGLQNDVGIWTEPNAYTHSFSRMGGSLTGSKGNVQPDDMVTSPMFVMGLLDLNQSTFEFEPVVFSDDAQQRFQDIDGRLRAELHGDSGLLNQFEINPSTMVETLAVEGSSYRDTSLIPIRAFLESSELANEIRIFLDSSQIATLSRSENSPEISSATLKREKGTNEMVINWSASDTDNDQLKSEILYTPDGNGQTIIPLVFNEDNAGSATIQLAGLPGGTTARFIIRVSDGWNTGEMMTEPINMPNNLPEAFIFNPGEADEINASEGLILTGAGNDVEDGFLMGDSLFWTIDDLPAGSGDYLITTPLDEGAHTIRLTVTDSDGVSAFTEVEINVTQGIQQVDNDQWLFY